jgi:hypothetical protein
VKTKLVHLQTTHDTYPSPMRSSGLYMKTIGWIAFILIANICFLAKGWSENLNHPNNQAPNNAGKNQSAITIQVGSYKIPDDAERQKARLIAHGLDASIGYEAVKDKGMMYRVYVGQFESFNAAKKYAGEISAKGWISGFWVKKRQITDPKPSEPPTLDKKKEPKSDPPVIPVKKVIVPEKAPVAASESGAIVKEPTIKENLGAEKMPDDPLPQDATDASLAKTKTVHHHRNVSIGLRPSIYKSAKANDFKIEQSGNDNNNSWSFDNTFVYIGLVGAYQINDKFSVEAGIDRDFMSDIDIWQLVAGAKYRFHQIGWGRPYLRGAVIVSNLKWEDAPGDFDTGLGLEGGLGIDFFYSSIKIGFETSYRRLRYNYNKPAGEDITATDDYLDVSGFSLSCTMSYLF